MVIEYSELTDQEKKIIMMDDDVKGRILCMKKSARQGPNIWRSNVLPLLAPSVRFPSSAPFAVSSSYQLEASLVFGP